MTPKDLRRSGPSRILLIWLNCLILLAVPAAQAEDAPDPLEVAKGSFMAASNPQTKLAVALDFLGTYPEHPESYQVVGEAARLLSGPLDDHSGAVALVGKYLARAGDSEARFSLQEILLDLYSSPGYGDDLQELVGQMYDQKAMSYVDHLTVIRAATEAEAWSLVDEQAAAAEPQATPEAFGAAYPDRGFSEEYIKKAGQNRQGLLKTYTGWSAARQGDTKRAIQDFKKAESLVRQSFFKLPENDLYRYWGRTLVSMGDTDKGLKMLSLAGLYGSDGEAADLARSTYLDLGKSEGDYENYLWKLRTKNAVKMVDFQANDYTDATVSYNGLRGKKATLLAFWFPT